MFTISIEGLKFYSMHGLYEMEKKVPQEFEVSIKIKLNKPEIKHIKLKDTVDYRKIYEVVKKLMEEPEELLENLSKKICQDLKMHFPLIISCYCRVQKYPQLGGLYNSVSLEWDE